MYTFSNRFNGSTLSRRIQMMNQQAPARSLTAGRYVLILSVFVLVGIACQFTRSDTSRYSQETNRGWYGIITAQTSRAHLDTLQQELNRRNVQFSFDKLHCMADGRIRQITVGLQADNQKRSSETTVGSPLGEAPITALGIHCFDGDCQIGVVDEKFPDRLQGLAKAESQQLLRDQELASITRDANAQFGVYRVYFRNDFMESSYFGQRNTLVRMTPDFHLALYPEARDAVVFLDGREINPDELANFHVLNLKRLVVYKGEAAVVRLGNTRAKNGLVLLTKRNSEEITYNYISTPLLRTVYPEIFDK
ncbi:hypothetical protein [Spirosoma pomorum]